MNVNAIHVRAHVFTCSRPKINNARKGDLAAEGFSKYGRQGWKTAMTGTTGHCQNVITFACPRM